MASKLPALKLSGALPERIKATVDIKAWANCLFNQEVYAVADPDEMQRQMLMRFLMAETVEEVLQDQEGYKLQDMVPDVAGASTPPLELTDIGVYPGDLGPTPGTFVVIFATNLETGEEIRFSTSATNVQVQLMKIMTLDTWPIKCRIKRLDAVDQGDRHIFRMVPVD